MLTRVLDLLVCPVCKGRLTAIAFPSGEKFPAGVTSSNTEIVEGLLSCNGGHAFPITNGIARLLPAGLTAFPAFVEEYRDHLARYRISVEQETQSKPGAIPGARGLQKVKAQFERQWDWWGKEEKLYGRTLQEMQDMLAGGYLGPGIDGDFLRGKWVLDAGCGHGAFVRGFAHLGAETVGLELGRGIDLAKEITQEVEGVHLIQGDIMHLPFRPEAFDLVFCHGVLPFLPSSGRGFHLLAKTVRQDGYFRIWVYPRRGWLWESAQDLIRGITTRLPPKLLYHLCFVPVPLLSFVKTYSNTSLRNSTWRQCAQVVWDYYSTPIQWHHTPEEVMGWYHQAGFDDVEFLSIPVSAMGRKIS